MVDLVGPRRRGRCLGRRRVVAGRRLELNRRRLVNGDAQPTDLLLDRRQNRYDRRQCVLVLRHQPPDVIDVLPGPIVVLSVALDVLEPDVEDTQRPLDGVQLGDRQKLDLGGAATAATSTAGAAYARGGTRPQRPTRGPARPDRQTALEVWTCDARWGHRIDVEMGRHLTTGGRLVSGRSVQTVSVSVVCGGRRRRCLINLTSFVNLINLISLVNLINYIIITIYLTPVKPVVCY